MLLINTDSQEAIYPVSPEIMNVKEYHIKEKLDFNEKSEDDNE